MSRDEETFGDVSTSVLLPTSGHVACRSDVALNMSADSDHSSVKDATGSVKITRKYVPVLTARRPGCIPNRGRHFLLVLCGLLVGTALVLMVAGTIRFHQCQDIQMSQFWDNTNSKTIDVDKMVSMNNFALERPTDQSSTAVLDFNGYSELAVDGDLTTCSRTDLEISPWWRVDLGKQRPIDYILVQGHSTEGLRDIVVHLESEEKLTDRRTNRSTCHSYNGVIPHESFVTECNGNANARYIIIKHKSFDKSSESTSNLVLCEVMVTQR